MLDMWERIKRQLAAQLTRESFQNWLEKTSLAREQGNSIQVRVPDLATKEWLEHEFREPVFKAVRQLGLNITEIHYSEADEIVHASLAPDLKDATAAAHLTFQQSTPQLNNRYRFQSFVVGSCNQFAHAAAKAVAENPARAYNPLFIYGGVGMGKTHLIHAIGHSLHESYPKLRIVYTTAERFMNELVTCIRTDRMALFHQHYRLADALLVDDVHIVAGRERTQEEFFHTFNELYDHQKQIVLSSDSAPKNTTGLVDRLRSRFEWGLMVDVQPPDLETKIAILDKKAEAQGISLPQDVRVFIATKTRSNVRELEGALVKLAAYTSVTEAPVTLDMARQVLKHLSSDRERRITIDAVIRTVAERFSMQPSQLKQRSNMKQIAYPRQIAMFLVKELTPASLPEIGKAFGGKHHTTVLHSIQKIDRLRHHEPDLNRTINSIIDSFN